MPDECRPRYLSGELGLAITPWQHEWLGGMPGVHPVRLAIVRRLAQGEACVGQLLVEMQVLGLRGDCGWGCHTGSSAPRRGVRRRLRGGGNGPMAPEGWHNLLEQGFDALFWEKDAAAVRTLFVSERIIDVLGYPIEWWMRRPGFWMEIVHPADRERVLALRQTAMASATDYACEYRVLALDASVQWVRQSTDLVWDARGEAEFLTGWTVLLNAAGHNPDRADRGQTQAETHRIRRRRAGTTGVRRASGVGHGGSLQRVGGARRPYLPTAHRRPCRASAPREVHLADQDVPLQPRLDVVQGAEEQQAGLSRAKRGINATGDIAVAFCQQFLRHRRLHRAVGLPQQLDFL